MLQHYLAGFDILGIGVIIGSFILFGALWKFLRDDLPLERSSQPAPERLVKRKAPAGQTTTERARTARPARARSRRAAL